MFKKEVAIERSRLGELLIEKGLITRSQLDQALIIQASTKMRLGEVLQAQGWLTELQLTRALKRQKRYRLAIAMAAAVTAPLTPVVAMAAPEVAVAAQMRMGGMQAIDDVGLESVSGQGGLNISASLSDAVAGAGGAGAVTSAVSTQQAVATGQAAGQVQGGSLAQLGQALMPQGHADAVSMAINAVKTVLPLQADISVNGAVYDNGNSPAATGLPIDANGDIQVAVPSHIDSIVFKNIQAQGAAAGGPTMGDVALVNVNMGNTSIKVSVH